MLQFLKNSTSQTVLWWPVMLRGSLYVAIATLTAALSELDSITAEDLASLTWLDWSKSALTIAVVGLTTLRTFIDQSVGHHEQKIKNGHAHQPASPGSSQ